MSDALLEIMQPLVEPIIEARLEPVIEARVEARMEPRILLREEAAKRKGREEGIQGMVDVLHDLGREDTEIRQIIRKKFDLSEEDAAEYL